MPTSFPVIGVPLGYRRILRVDVEQNLLTNLTLERMWINRHVQHIFEIPWGTLTNTQRATLVTFFNTCRGRIQSDISFTDPFDSESYTCRLDNDILELAAVDVVVWSAPIRLVEVSGWKALKAAVDPFPAAVPFQGYGYGIRYDTVIAGQADNHEHRYENYSSSIQRWRAGGGALTTSQAEDLCDAWEGNGGPYRQFSFTDPHNSATFDAHFADTQLTCSSVALDVWSCITTVEELK